MQPSAGALCGLVYSVITTTMLTSNKQDASKRIWYLLRMATSSMWAIISTSTSATWWLRSFSRCASTNRHHTISPLCARSKISSATSSPSPKMTAGTGALPYSHHARIRCFRLPLPVSLSCCLLFVRIHLKCLQKDELRRLS